MKSLPRAQMKASSKGSTRALQFPFTAMCVCVEFEQIAIRLMILRCRTRARTTRTGLLVFEFTSDSVVLDVLPVDLGSRQRQWSTQRLEGRLRHGLVVLADRRLIGVLSLFDDVHEVVGQLLDILRRGVENGRRVNERELVIELISGIFIN